MFMLGRYFDPFIYPFLVSCSFFLLLLSPPTSQSYSHFHYCYSPSYCQENIWIEEEIKMGNGEYAVSNIMICSVSIVRIVAFWRLLDRKQEMHTAF
jgi:hypothetical protein